MRHTILLLGAALLACPTRSAPQGPGDASAAASACTKFGQTCEFAPGKLGSCVQLDDCTKEPCLVCQSQH